MNKKVLTLCAGFLLAGGMLSSVSAENISELTEGKYYKIVRTWERATDSGTHAGWSVMEAGYYLGATSMDMEATLWKAVKNADGTISLVNMEGERFTLESEGSSVSNFTIDYSGNEMKFTIKGYGHGVGMSQWGAQGMAQKGYKYYDILFHYFKDTNIKDIY